MIDISQPQYEQDFMPFRNHHTIGIHYTAFVDICALTYNIKQSSLIVIKPTAPFHKPISQIQNQCTL